MKIRPIRFLNIVVAVLTLGGLGVFALPSVPAQAPAATPARTLTASYPLAVYQIVDGQTHPRKLGTTGMAFKGLIGPGARPAQPAVVQIPANVQWYVNYTVGGFGFGAFGFNGAIGGVGGIIGGIPPGAFPMQPGNLGALGSFQGQLGQPPMPPPPAGMIGLIGGQPGNFGIIGGQGNIGMPVPGAAKLTGKDLQAMLAELKKAAVPGLRLEHVELSDDDLAVLVKELPGLQTLLLVNTKTTDAGVAHLVGLKNLRVLGLEGTGFTDAALTAVAKLKPLDTLRLGGSGFTNKGSSILGEVKGLRILRLTWTGIEKEGFDPLAKIDTLESLEVVGESTDADLAGFKAIPNLKQVRLHYSKMSARGIEALSKLEKLEQLTLDWMWGEDGPILFGFGAIGGGLVFPGAPGAGQVAFQVPVSPVLILPDGMPKQKPEPTCRPADLATLTNAKGLTSLYLMGKEFGDGESEAIKGCVALKKLELFAPNLTDVGVASLKELKALERLNLCFSKATPACTSTLKTLPALKTFYAPVLPFDAATKRILAQFQAGLPKVSVFSLTSMPGYENLALMLGMTIP